ncbi:hypothetical protein ACQ86N_01475 [Puia sp. P3]|uniref:hypothetical protein n=1 Tax=Puia sp. P3 TaxID=3423952 RepID=UPI003D66BA45
MAYEGQGPIAFDDQLGESLVKRKDSASVAAADSCSSATSAQVPATANPSPSARPPATTTRSSCPTAARSSSTPGPTSPSAPAMA